MCEKRIFGGQFSEPLLRLGGFAILVGQGMGLQKACLTQEKGFYLKDAVAMFCRGVERNIVGPLLKGVAVYSETEVARHCNEANAFPIVFTPVETLEDARDFGFEAFHMQCREPVFHFYTFDKRYLSPARRKTFLALQHRIIFLHIFRHLHHELR